MKLSRYVFSFLEQKGVSTVFFLPGGGCMHLLDSLAASERVRGVSLLHEQAVAVACEAYANTTGGMGVALATSGPGATNLLTGVLAAYIDSAPCFFMTGQAKTADLRGRYGVRAMGSQEADIVAMASPSCKYAAQVKTKESVRYHLERAWHEAMSGRKGPVLLDFPLDIQGADINPDELPGYTPPVSKRAFDAEAIMAALARAKRPVIIAGNGLSGCKASFYELIEFLGIPVITTWKAMDYLAAGHPLYAGHCGGMGDRTGNLTVQNADLVLSLGSRLDFSITGFDRSAWAPKAEKIIVDIDEAELRKLEDLGDFTPVAADVELVIAGLLAGKEKLALPDLSPWKSRIAVWKQRYPVLTPDKRLTPTGRLTTYALVDRLCAQLGKDALVAPCSSGTTAEIFFQAFTVKAGQMVRSNHGLGSMGFEIPNAIGMCVASGGKPVVCIAGDGGMQLNIQELAVIRGRNLPIKLFVVNNNGYASIRNMQKGHFENRYCGCDGNSGLFLPDLRALGRAYELPYLRAERPEELERAISRALKEDGPIICEVMVEPDCLVSPRSATQVMPDGSLRSSPLENQFPFLPDEEARENML